MSAIYGIPYEELGMQQHEAMSDTPETDAAEYGAASENEREKRVVSDRFARRLERELAALRAEVELLKKTPLRQNIQQLERDVNHWCDVHTVASKERDALRSQVAVLREALLDITDVQASQPGPVRWAAYQKARAALNSTAETK